MLPGEFVVMPSNELEECRLKVIELAKRVGKYQCEQLNQVHDVTLKAHLNDLVSEVDVESERMITEWLFEHFPNDGLLGEEGALKEGTSGRRWVIDPLDGTRNYLTLSGPWTVCISLEIDDEPVVGIVHDPLLNETFSASKGGGAWLNGRPISVSETTDLKQALFAISFFTSDQNKEIVAQLINNSLLKFGDFRRLPAAITLVYVAAGRVDCGMNLGVKLWDISAGLIIAREAGAWTGDGYGNEAGPHRSLTSAPGIAESFIKALS